MTRQEVYQMKADLIHSMLEKVAALRDADLEELTHPVEGMTVWSPDDVETLAEAIGTLFEELQMLAEEIAPYNARRADAQ